MAKHTCLWWQATGVALQTKSVPGAVKFDCAIANQIVPWYVLLGCKTWLAEQRIRGAKNFLRLLGISPFLLGTKFVALH